VYQPSRSTTRAARLLCLALVFSPRPGWAQSAEWVRIPAGEFRFGCEPKDPDCEANEKPGKRTKVRAFKMMRTEVTVASYAACVAAKACTAPGDFDSLCNWMAKGRENHPVNCVDWGQAAAFCAWARGRLPTAVEWEYAAKGGQARVYPWGNEAPSCERALAAVKGEGDGCGKQSTWPVCSKPSGASAQGLCDLAGNVWEWTASDFSPEEKELRGGAWIEPVGLLRASMRGRSQPAVKVTATGFRCAQ